MRPWRSFTAHGQPIFAPRVKGRPEITAQSAIRAAYVAVPFTIFILLLTRDDLAVRRSLLRIAFRTDPIDDIGAVEFAIDRADVIGAHAGAALRCFAGQYAQR